MNALHEYIDKVGLYKVHYDTLTKISIPSSPDGELVTIVTVPVTLLKEVKVVCISDIS